MRSFFSLSRRKPLHSSGFSLLEVLVSVAIVIVILVSVLQFVSNVEQTWKKTSTDPFADAENAFETMSRNLAEATLEPYQDYAAMDGSFSSSTNSSFAPDHLARRSDLDFICGPSTGINASKLPNGRIFTGCDIFFIKPQGYTQRSPHQGMDHLLNAMGYFVEFSDDDTTPLFLSLSYHRWRWRLKQIQQSTESLQVFQTNKSDEWIQKLFQTGTATPVLAENIITLVVVPERIVSDKSPPLAPDFVYDSRDVSNPTTRNQLPPRLKLILVAIDEASAQLLASQNGSNPPPLIPANLFQIAAPSQLNQDVATLDDSLTAKKIRHRIFQRDIQLTSSAWSITSSQ